MVGLYTVLSQFSLGVCDVILPSVAFLIDNSWLVKMQVYEKVCHLSLCFLPCDIIYNNSFLWSPIKPPYFQIRWPVSKNVSHRNADT